MSNMDIDLTDGLERKQDIQQAKEPGKPKTATKKPNYLLPWLEKYRPTKLKDIVGNLEVVQRLEIIAQDGNMPNVILSGPPGTGKTTSIHCLAHALLGPKFKDAVLELNASDERGIDVVRNKIKMFAQTAINSLPPGRHKVVILDEADSMTQAAQQALRRTMEIYSNTTRFALACNQSSKIIEPIQSRCAIVRYQRLSDKEILQRLLYICEQEQVAYVNEGLEALIFTADGDMRQAINNLQATHTGLGVVNSDNVFQVCDQPHPLLISNVLVQCTKANILEAFKDLKVLFDQGYAATDIITTMFRVARNIDLQEFVKLEYIKEIGNCHMRISDGITSQLQLSGLLAKLCQIAIKARQK